MKSSFEARRSERSGKVLKTRGASAIAACGFILLWIFVSVRFHVLWHDASDRTGLPLFGQSEVTPPVAAIFAHACINCHSEKTDWPWYSQIAPVSWLVERDVKSARKRMNFSRWDGLETSSRSHLLAEIARVIENHEMPLARYVMLHPGAKLSADESVEVIEWTREERRRLREDAGERSRD